VASKAELGNASGLEKPTAAVALLDVGKGKSQLEALTEQIDKLKK
jgi:ribosomal protein L7Ae-like RNA K-turn-binding protein